MENTDVLRDLVAVFGVFFAALVATILTAAATIPKDFESFGRLVFSLIVTCGVGMASFMLAIYAVILMVLK